MARPRLLLVPEITELEWVIRPQLEEWAEVAAYDPPGVGAEPLSEEQIEAVRSGERRVRDLIVNRGLEELDRRGWDRFFLVADTWGNATAARIAHERRGAVQGIALGHACLSYEMEGDRAPVNREIWAALRQLLQQDHRQFIRFGIVQATRGAIDEELADRMLERLPDREVVEVFWEALGSESEPIGEMLREVSCPLLFAQHVGCIVFPGEGFEDAVAAFPEARVVRASGTSNSEEFAEALREFCEEVEAAGAGHRPGTRGKSAAT